MKKKLLGELPIKRRTTPLNEYIYTFEAEKKIVYHEIHLVVNIYYKNNQEPNFRVFLKKDDYITQDMQMGEPKWVSGKIYNYASRRLYYWKKDYEKGNAVYADENTIKLVQNFLKTKETDIRKAIMSFQNKIAERKIKEAEDKITKPIDEKMKKDIKELPRRFERWLTEEVFKNDKFIYYDYEKGKTDMIGCCTYCKQNVLITKPKHNKYGVCPNCGEIVQFKAKSKMPKGEFRREKRVTFVQKTKEGFVIRFFEISKGFSRYWLEDKYYYYEYTRWFYEGEKISVYDYGMFKNKYIRWNKVPIYHYYGQEKNKIYPETIKDIKNNELYKYCAIEEFYKHFKEFDLRRYLRENKECNNYIERLVKVGLTNLAYDLVHCMQVGEVDSKQTKINKMLGIENDDSKVLIEANVNYTQFHLFKILRKKGTRMTVEQLNLVKGITENTVLEILEYVTMAKFAKYIKNQKDIGESVIMYRDYLNMAAELKYNMQKNFILFPKHLNEAHNTAVELINLKKADKMNKKYKKIEKMEQKLNEIYGYEDEEYVLMAPKNAYEIVKEEQALQHCVGQDRFIKNMAAEESAIFFIRRKEEKDKPFVTLELNLVDNNIVQYHGYKNELGGIDNKSKTKGFVEKWDKNILKK